MKEYYIPVFFLCCVLLCTANADQRISLEPSPGDDLMTAKIQDAIDRCAAAGGGTVFFAAGNYNTGGLHLKSDITLEFAKDAKLIGSADYRDYGKWSWGNALIRGEGLTNIVIKGEGVLDGSDCRCPHGEEGFRGPHCIRLVNCVNIEVSDIKIVRSANWALNFRHCRKGRVERVTVLGGHDAFHSRFGSDFTVTDCDFRTGDDAVAGNDNRDFVIRNCRLNTSCNAFRFGCLNLLVEGCHIQGPGEYKHLKQNRNNTLSAFVHFAPKDDNAKRESGNWLIRDLAVDNVDNLYMYNFPKGLWQTGQPATTIRFENVKATNLKRCFTVVGDTERKFELSIKNAHFSQTKGAKAAGSFEGAKLTSPHFCSFKSFGSVTMENVTFDLPEGAPAITAENGDVFSTKDAVLSGTEEPVAVSLKNVEKIAD